MDFNVEEIDFEEVFNEIVASEEQIQPIEFNEFWQNYLKTTNREKMEQQRIEIIHMEDELKKLDKDYRNLANEASREQDESKFQPYIDELSKRDKELLEKERAITTAKFEYLDILKEAREKSMPIYNDLNNQLKQLEQMKTKLQNILDSQRIMFHPLEQEKCKKEIEKISEKISILEENLALVTRSINYNLDVNVHRLEGELKDKKAKIVESNKDKEETVVETTPEKVSTNVEPISNGFVYVINKEQTMQNYRKSGYEKNAEGWYFNPNIDEYDENYDPLTDPLFQAFDAYEVRKVVEPNQTMQNYRNSGYGKNAEGWYFNPNIDEYDENYDPLTDPLFQVFVTEYVKAGIKEYKEIDNGKIIDQIPTDGNVVTDDDKIIIDDSTPQQKKIEDIDSYATDYYKHLEEYNNELENWKNELASFIEISNKFENGEITQEEYDEYFHTLEEDYSYMKEKYNAIKKEYEQTVEHVRNDERWHPALTEEQIKELREMGVLKPGGEKYEQYLIEHGINKNEILSPEEPVAPSKEIEEEIVPIDNIEHKPKLTWKTAVAVAAGIGAGVALFEFGGVALATGVIAATVGRIAAGIQRKKAHKKGWVTAADVNDIDMPSGKLKQAAHKLRNYFKSEEGLRDLSWGFSSELITVSALSIAEKLGLINKPQPQPVATTESNQAVAQTTTQPAPTPTPDLSVNDALGKYVPTEGHVSAGFASKGVNTVGLNPNYVTANSHVSRIAAYGPDGLLRDFGSVSEAVKAGFEPSDVLVRIAKTAGGSDYQAWTNLAEMGYKVADVAGKVM